jgi:hypothetical protein
MSETLTSEQLRVLLDVAANLAYNEVERRVRIALKGHRGWGFCMAMGSATFFPTLLKGGEHETERDWMKPTMEFIEEFDRDLHLTGMPMKIMSAGSVLVKDWGTWGKQA